MKYHLQGYTPHNLHYLCKGDIIQDETQDRIRFSAWKVMDKKIAFLSIYTSVVHVEHLEGPFVTDIEKWKKAFVQAWYCVCYMYI